MVFLGLFRGYFKWHYTNAFKDFFVIWCNFLHFFYNFFSITLLLKTFFSPFKRLDEGSQSLLNPSKFFDSLIVGTLMRLVGVIVRTIIILIGLFSILLLTIFGVVAFFVWIVLPIIIIIGFIESIIFIL